MPLVGFPPTYVFDSTGIRVSSVAFSVPVLVIADVGVAVAAKIHTTTFSFTIPIITYMHIVRLSVVGCAFSRLSSVLNLT